MDGANSTEFDLETEWPVIDLLPEQKEVSDLGGTMRLGADPIKLHADTPCAGDLRRGGRVRAPPPPLRGVDQPAQAAGGGGPRRLRHLAGRAARGGRRAAADQHPFFVASQYHPEFKSRPERPAPLFRDFVAAALDRAREGAGDVPEGGSVRASRSAAA